MQARNDRDTIGAGVRILFSENLGQWNERVLFRSQMHAATLFVERDCFTFVIQHPDNENLQHPRPQKKQNVSHYRSHAYRMHFEGGSSDRVEGLERQTGYENYFLGRDHWASGVGVFQSVFYHDLYDGIDLKVYTASNAMKYDFIVRQGGNPDNIAMRYEGVDDLRMQNGNLIIKTSVSDIVEIRPFAYQIMGDRQIEIPARFRLKGDRVTFELGDYDTSLPLIIDPYLYFSTYTGSVADNWGTTGCYDSYKNTYTSGLVFGSGYPISLGAYDGSYNGNADIGIFKFDTSGTQRLYATYLGGNKADMPHSMFVNSLDELVIFGTTGSSDFPVTPNAYDTSFNGGTALQYEHSSTINFPNGVDIFICRFSSDGSQLQASTYVGGSGNDGLNYRNSFDYDIVMIGNDSLYFNYGDGARGEIITDDLNNIYVGSTTVSNDFPTTANCIQPTNHGRQDGVVFKIDYNLSNMIWSTYLGGLKDDAVYSIDCDKDYNVVVTGGTNSYNFPTTQGAYRTYYNGGSADAFVAKISYYGNTLMSSTLFGSSTYDHSYFVRCGKNNDVFIFGQTKAAGSTLIRNANYNTPNSGQFLARFKPNLDSLVWSTVFGDGSGTPNISPTAFAVDICNRIYLSGWGRIFRGLTWNGVNYPWNTGGTIGLSITSDAYQSTSDGQDFYIMSLDIDANNLVYASFFGELHSSSGGYYSGSDHVDGGTSRFDRLGTLYQAVCASCSENDDFPVTTGAWSEHNNSNNCNNAIFRINLTDDFPVAEFTQPLSGCAPQQISFHNTGRGDSYLWDFGDGTTSIAESPTHTYTTPGFYTVTLVAFMPAGCRSSDTMSHQILVLGLGNFNLDTLYTCPGTSLQIGLRPSSGCNYNWIQGSVSDSTISNPMVNQPGTYRLVISNAECSDTVTQIVEIGETAAQIIGDSVTCSIPSSLDIYAEGNSITYQWSSNRDLTDTLNSDMSTGNYSFDPTGQQWLYMHVVDDRGCYKTDSIHVRLYRVVDSLIITSPICPNDCMGSVCVVPSALAVPPYQYNWNNGWTNSDCFHQLCEGTYTMLFRDANGCLVTNTFTITDPEPPTIDATVQHIHCLESCTGTITVNVTGNSTYSLLWLDDSSTSASRIDLCAGDYILQVRDSNGCIFHDTITILENVDISISISDIKNSCPDNCSGSATASVSGGAAPYTFLWSSGEESPTAHQLCNGMVYVVVTDSYGCTIQDSVMIGIQSSFANINVWADDEYVFSPGSTTLHVTEIPQGNYWWSPSQQVNNPSSPNPTATLEDTTTFIVTVTDSIGCVYTDSLRVACVNVNCGKTNLFIPNAFTPNNDGKNDQLCFSGEWITDFHIVIFTRWGEKVYESDDITKCWDGRFHDNWCMPGVYVYHCSIKCADGQVSQFKGDVTLIR